MNIRFEYMYRDAGNYKQWNDVVFSNPNGLCPLELEMSIRKVLVDGEYFTAKELALKDLHFIVFDEELDHGWHEFHKCTITSEVPNDALGRTIEDFLSIIKQSAQSRR